MSLRKEKLGVGKIVEDCFGRKVATVLRTHPLIAVKANLLTLAEIIALHSAPEQRM
jgi:hypothetical protein